MYFKILQLELFGDLEYCRAKSKKEKNSKLSLYQLLFSINNQYGIRQYSFIGIDIYLAQISIIFNKALLYYYYYRKLLSRFYKELKMKEVNSKYKNMKSLIVICII